MLSFSTISIYKYVAHDRDPQKAKKRKRLSSFTFFSFSSKMKRSIKPYLCRFIENSYPVSFFYAKEMFDIHYIEKIQKTFFSKHSLTTYLLNGILITQSFSSTGIKFFRLSYFGNIINCNRILKFLKTDNLLIQTL